MGDHERIVATLNNGKSAGQTGVFEMSLFKMRGA